MTFDELRRSAEESLEGEPLAVGLADLDNLEAAAYLEQSALGQIGKVVAPVFRPLGWDWRVSAAVLASFPAREVVLAVLGTIYAVGSDVDADDPSLVANIRAAKHPDGTPVFTLAMALGVMVFFAFCLQCGATVAAIRRETNSWAWPVFAWGYMTGLAYVAAWATYALGNLFLGAA